MHKIKTTIIGKKKKYHYLYFKAFLLLSFPLIFFPGCSLSRKVKPIETAINRTEALVIDHTCTSISQIPVRWIKKAKAELGISYGHTSHGSQIVSGMRVLMDQSTLYSFDRYGSKKSLALYDREPRGNLGNPGRITSALRTRKFLDTGWGDAKVAGHSLIY